MRVISSSMQFFMAGEGILSCERPFAFFAYKGSRSRIFNSRQFEVVEGLFCILGVSFLRLRSCLCTTSQSPATEVGGRGLSSPTLKCSPFEKALWQYLHSIFSQFLMSPRLVAQLFLSSNSVAVNSLELFVHVEGQEHEGGRFA